jgi:multidrug efflux system outer membrane protein
MAPERIAPKTVVVPATVTLGPAPSMSPAIAAPTAPRIAEPVTTEPGVEPGLAQLLQMVAANNDAFRIAQQQLHEAQAEHLDAVGKFFPKLEIQEQGQLYRNVSGIPAATLVGSNIVLTQGSIYSNYLSLVASLNLFAGGSDVERIMAAHQGIEQARSEMVDRKNQALISTLLAYEALQSLLNQEDVGRQLAENARQGLLLMQQRWQRGNASLLALTQQRTKLLQALQQLESLQKKLVKARNDLVLLAGSDKAFALVNSLSRREVIPPPPTAVSPEELTDSWRMAPAVQAAHHAYEQASHEVSVVRGTFLPQVNLQASYNWLGSSSANFGDALNSVQRNSYTVGLSITQSLAPFTGHLSRFHTAEAKREIAAIQLQQATLKAKAQLRQAVEELRDGQLRMQNFQVQAAAAQKSAQFAQELYHHGRENVLQEKQAMLNAQTAQLAYRESQMQWAVAQWIALSLRDPSSFAAILLNTVAQ